MAFCEDAVAQTIKAFGKLDILVNNAAWQESHDNVEDITEEQFEHTFRVISTPPSMRASSSTRSSAPSAVTVVRLVRPSVSLATRS